MKHKLAMTRVEQQPDGPHKHQIEPTAALTASVLSKSMQYWSCVEHDTHRNNVDVEYALGGWDEGKVDGVRQGPELVAGNDRGDQLFLYDHIEGVNK